MRVLRQILRAFTWCLILPAAAVLAIVLSAPRLAIALLHGIELVLDLAGPAGLASGADEHSALDEWARLAGPTYLNLRKASIYGGSNEVQRQIISRNILGL